MSDAAFASKLGELAADEATTTPASSAPTAVSAPSSDASFVASSDAAVAAAAPEEVQPAPEPLAPCHAPVMSKTVILHRVLDARRLHNPYVDARTRRAEIAAVENRFRARCAPFGFVSAVRTAEDGAVSVTFAERESARKCIDGLHGRRLGGLEDGDDGDANATGEQLVADYDFDAGRSSVSRAVRIYNVFDPTALHSDHRDAFLAQLAVDFEVECSQFGPLARPLDVMHLDGGVRPVFESTVSAGDCIFAMDGRWFDQRQLAAEYDLTYDHQAETAAAAAAAAPAAAPTRFAAATLATVETSAPKRRRAAADGSDEDSDGGDAPLAAYASAKDHWGECHPAKRARAAAASGDGGQGTVPTVAAKPAPAPPAAASAAGVTVGGGGGLSLVGYDDSSESDGG